MAQARFNKAAMTDWRLRREIKHNQPRRILWRGLRRVAFGTLITLAAFGLALLQQSLLLQVGSGLGLVGMGVRVGLHFDMYFARRVRLGSRNRFTNFMERAFRKTPYRYFNTMRIHALEMRDTHIKFIQQLQEKREREPQNIAAINKDISDFNQISKFVNPFRNITWGGVLGLAVGTALTKTAVKFARDANINPVGIILGQTVGYGISLAYTAAEFGVYATKRIAAGDKDQNMHHVHKFMLGVSHKVIMNTPLRYASWYLLRSEYKRVAKITVSPTLKQHLDASDMSRQLDILAQAASSPKEIRNVQTMAMKNFHRPAF